MSIKQFVHRYKITSKIVGLMRHPIQIGGGWLYGAYLTIRYVDEYNVFPAISFRRLIRINVYKGNNSKLKIDSRLIIKPWCGGSSQSYIGISENACIHILGDFIIGDDVRINLAKGANLKIYGRESSSGSGITAKSVILVQKQVEIGKDCIIAWNTFITDSDHHPIDGKLKVEPTYIREHVWIGADSLVLKGSDIGKDSIVAPNSVVTMAKYPEKSLLAGTPAKVIRNQVETWSRD